MKPPQRKDLVAEERPEEKEEPEDDLFGGGLGEDPLSADGLLEQTFYRSPSLAEEKAAFQAEAQQKKAKKKKPKPTHYKIVSISLYNEDIERLEQMVAELKRRGFTKANKSQLIRYALDTVDLDNMPRGY